MLTILVPITSGDVTANFQTLSDLESSVIPSEQNLNNIYSVGGTLYYRPWYNKATRNYEFKNVVDREFPELGKPFEIFDFNYDSTRMGQAPTITAQNVKWYADKDADGNDITLDGRWSQACHVTFNNQNFYLKLIPTASKSNEDARYNYNIDFVDERVVLEHVYLYDVVQPFISERPVSESSEFSFYGDISELVNRINASLVRSGLAKLQLKEGVVDGSFLTYSEFNQSGIGSYTGDKNINYSSSETYFEHFGGDYNLYLLECVYLLENNAPVVSGYKCVIGKDKYGEVTKSEEKLITFENNTIHEALQQVYDTFDLQYYVTKDSDGNTIITIGDCEHDFADWDEDNDDYVRDSEGVPTTAHPFDYGVDDALLSKEKANTTDKIVTRITGVGSEENIPWYYPNPTADGWIKPTYKRDGEDTSININYPLSEGTTPTESVRYEKYLKNRIGNIFQFGKLIDKTNKVLFDSCSFERIGTSDYYNITIIYKFSISENSRQVVKFNNSYLDSTAVYTLEQKISGVYTDVTSEYDIDFTEGGKCELSEGDYRLTYTIRLIPDETIFGDVNLYFYGAKTCHCTILDTWDWQTLLAIFSIGLTSILSGDMFNGFDVTFPPFFSTNPNLQFHESKNAKLVGWKNGSSYITESDMQFGSYYGTFFAFAGGNGSQIVGTDTVYKITYNYNEGKFNAPVIVNRSLNNYSDAKYYFTNYIQNEGGRRIIIPSMIDTSVNVSVEKFIAQYLDFEMGVYICDGWYKDNKKVNLADYGISNESSLTATAEVFDTIEFSRVKYVTPQPMLMPEVYIKTDGERRFYNAYNYPLSGRTPDAASGEELQSGEIINPLYKNDDDSPHYDFENEYMQNIPHEHIEVFEDVKPTIKGQTNYIRVNPTEEEFNEHKENFYIVNIVGQYVQCTSSTSYNSGTQYYILARIDVVEEFAYDEYDNDEVWESNDDSGTQGEYKHPYFFAKLRPLGFNIFDLALQEDMVLSMTTGHCGACNFKIAVNEDTKKNPVQIWEYDVYEKDGDEYTLLYHKGTLRRVIIDTSKLFYNINNVYVNIDSASFFKPGFVINEDTINRNIHGKLKAYTGLEITKGEVGALKFREHTEGDVMTSGRYIESQQDTSENYVWVALTKDTDTYGTIMPSAKPDYGDNNYSVYIDPKGATYNDRKNGTTSYFSDEDADKFVLTNIRLPQVYLRRAEKDLSRRIIACMYDNNYQKYNFSINFSRIFLAQNSNIDDYLNENSVLYVTFNNKIYRQYVKSYSYKMSKDAVLPEISVELNEELNVTRTIIEQQAALSFRSTNRNNRRWKYMLDHLKEQVGHGTVSRYEDTVITGSMFSKDTSKSFAELHSRQIEDKERFEELDFNLGSRHSQLKDKYNSFVTEVGDSIHRIKTTMENRLIPVSVGAQQIAGCSGAVSYTFGTHEEGVKENFWYSARGSITTLTYPIGTCGHLNDDYNGWEEATWSNYRDL